MSRERFAPIVVIVLAVLILVAGFWYYKTHSSLALQNTSEILRVPTVVPTDNPASLAPQGQSNSELTPQEDARITKSYAVSVGSPGNYAVFPSETDLRQALMQLGGGIPFTITNIGTHDDTYFVTATSLLGWGDLTNIPVSVKVVSQSKTTINIPVHLPSSIPHGTEEHIKFLVKSASSPALFDSVDMTIGISR